MRIFITPEEIVRLCLWDLYSYYIVGSEKESEKILKENKEIELSEKDGYVIGFLKTMESDNLIHKFNLHVTDYLTTRSVKEKEGVYIRKKTLETAVEKFLSKFPDYWEPNIVFKKALEEFKVYVDRFSKSVDNMETIKYTYQNITSEYINVNHVKKEIKFNYM